MLNQDGVAQPSTTSPPARTRRLYVASLVLAAASLAIPQAAAAGEFDAVTPELLAKAKEAVKKSFVVSRDCATYKADGVKLPGGSQKLACALKGEFAKVVLMINREPDNEGNDQQRAQYSKAALEWELKNLDSMGKLGMRVVPQDIEVFSVKQFVPGTGSTDKNVWAYVRADVDFSRFEEFHWLTQLNVSRPEKGPPPLSRLLERYRLTQRAQEQYCFDLMRFRESLDAIVVLDIQGALNLATGEIYWMDPFGTWRFMDQGDTPQTIVASRLDVRSWQAFPESVKDHPFFKNVFTFRNQALNSFMRLYVRDCLTYPDSNFGDNPTRERFNMGRLPQEYTGY